MDDRETSFPDNFEIFLLAPRRVILVLTYVTTMAQNALWCGKILNSFLQPPPSVPTT